MKILIPNATGPTNLGDRAILEGLRILLRENSASDHVIIHSSVPHCYGRDVGPVKPTIYYWSVFMPGNFAGRIFRLAALGLQYLLLKAGVRALLPNRKLRELVRDYQSADCIIFAGGGYLRSNPGLTQSLNLVMTLFIFEFASLFGKRTVVAPMSFGPFAHPWQERLAARVLGKMDLVCVREGISSGILGKYRLGNVMTSADQALLLESVRRDSTGRPPVLGFTIRNWGSSAETAKNTGIILESIVGFVRAHPGVVVQPIVQVSSLEHGDEDAVIAQAVYGDLVSYGIRTYPVLTLRTLADALSAYSELDMIIGMRMHSNIIAATQGTPFVAIAYEHKTRGISAMLGVEDYCLDYSAFTADDLLFLLEKMHANSAALNQTIRQNLAKIKEREFAAWSKILTGLRANLGNLS